MLRSSDRRLAQRNQAGLVLHHQVHLTPGVGGISRASVSLTMWTGGRMPEPLADLNFPCREPNRPLASVCCRFFRLHFSTKRAPPSLGCVSIPLSAAFRRHWPRLADRPPGG